MKAPIQGLVKAERKTTIIRRFGLPDGSCCWGSLRGKADSKEPKIPKQESTNSCSVAGDTAQYRPLHALYLLHKLKKINETHSKVQMTL